MPRTQRIELDKDIILNRLNKISVGEGRERLEGWFDCWYDSIYTSIWLYSFFINNSRCITSLTIHGITTMVEIEQLSPDATNAYRMATRTRTYLPRIPS